jgi:hypothetical protein
VDESIQELKKVRQMMSFWSARVEGERQKKKKKKKGEEKIRADVFHAHYTHFPFIHLRQNGQPHAPWTSPAL